jgi:hypothetical protein
MTIRIGFFLWAICLVFRGNEAWCVGNNTVVAYDWFFINMLSPAAATLIIIGELIRHGKRVRSFRRYSVRQTDGGPGVSTVQFMAPGEIPADKQNSDELQLLRAEFAELKKSLDEMQLRREKAKSNFDLFLESRENK